MSTINALSVSHTDVATAVATAVNGDVVVIPSGSASWVATLVIPAGVSLRGATTVTGDHVIGLTATDNTVILDNIPRVNGDSQVLFITTESGKDQTIQGITFKGDTVHNISQNGGAIVIMGDSSTVRFTQLHFDNVYALQDYAVRGRVYGVADRCLHDSLDLAVLIQNGGTYDTYGDESWTLGPKFGTADFWVMEDCYFNNHDPSVQTHANIDCAMGGRYVARYSIFRNSKANSHGTETYGRLRSSRAIEIYNNRFVWDANYGATGGQLRGGTAVIHDNAYTLFGSGLGLRIYHMFGTFLFQAADGTSGWDSNDSHGLYASGTASSTGTEGVLNVITSSWTTNQWVGYVIRNTTAGNTWNSYVTSNTASSINFWPENNDGTPYIFNSGNTFEIRKVLVALDQPGRGKGDLIRDYPPVNNTTGTIAWPNQALEPVFSWNNTNNGVAGFGIGSYGEPSLQENRDFYNRAPQSGDYLYPYTPLAYPHTLIGGGADTTPPVVSITAPSDNARVSGFVTISADATDNVAVAGVTFKYGSTTIGSEDTSLAYAVLWDTTQVSNGDYTLHAIARDTSNNTTDTTILVTVHNIPPVVVIPPVPVKKKGESEEGTTLIVTGTLAIEFTPACPDTDYTIEELEVQNTTDMSPLILIPTLTAVLDTGFTVSFNGTPDTVHYLLRWKVTA